MEVDLRPVEGAIPGVEHVRQLRPRQGLGQGVLGGLPHLVAADGLVRPGGQLHVHLVEPERPVHLPDEADDAQHLVFHLLGQAVDVRVVLGEHPHAEETGEHP